MSGTASPTAFNGLGLPFNFRFSLPTGLTETAASAGQAINFSIDQPLSAAANAAQTAVKAALKTGLTTQGVTAATSPQSASATAPADFRARLRPLNPDDVYGSNVHKSLGPLAGNSSKASAAGGLLSILQETQGMIFPYTPTIAFSQDVNYADLSMVQTNSDYQAYTRTPSVTISVTGKFTVQNQREGLYALAVIHFLRTVSKSYFGETDAKHGKAGLPPPILLFSAYGAYVYNNLRVILKNHAWTADESMDTVPVQVPAVGNNRPTTVRLPALFTVQTSLMVIQTPQRMRKDFSFDAFASGKLMGGTDGGWI